MSDRFDFLELDNSRPIRHPGRDTEAAREQHQATVSRPPSPAWKVVEIIGGPGSGAGQFASPSGLAVDPAGTLFVADSYSHRVQRITPSGDVSVLGRRGTGPGEFLNPQAVVTDDGLGFYVLEQGGCRIQRFGPNGEWLGAFGFRGGGRGEMLAPTAMARGPCGSLFVADTGNNRVIKWSAADVFVDSFPRRFDPPLARPQGIAVDRAGRVWLAETPRHQLVTFDALLRPLGRLGGAGEEPGQFREPLGLAVSPAGSVMVADAGNNRVQVLDREGRPLQAIGGKREAGVSPLDAPAGLAIRGEEEAYVADTGNNRVLRLQREQG